MRVSRRSGTDFRCSLVQGSENADWTEIYILTFDLRGASFPPRSALWPKAVLGQLACCLGRPSTLVKRSERPRSAPESRRGDLIVTNGGEEQQQTLGSVLENSGEDVKVDNYGNNERLAVN